MVQETAKERWERNFGDLLQELRVAQTGVQILFAFLLTLPFNSGFSDTTRLQKDLYLIALLSAAAATAAIISPVAFHRGLFRRGRKPEVVRYAHRMASVGLAFMLVSMVSSVFLITDFLLDQMSAMIITGVAAVLFLAMWVVLPLGARHASEEDPGAD